MKCVAFSERYTTVTTCIFVNTADLRQTRKMKSHQLLFLLSNRGNVVKCFIIADKLLVQRS